jgi:integrase
MRFAVPPPKPGKTWHTVKKRLASGEIKEYHYHRETRTKLEGEPGSPEFERSLRRASQPARTPVVQQSSCWPALIDAYQRSPEYKGLVQKSQNDIDRRLKRVAEALDWVTLPDLNNRAVRGDFFDLRDKMSSTPVEADATIGALGRLLQWAYDRGRIDVNHAIRIPLLAQTSPRKDITFSPAQVNAVLDACGPDDRPMFLIALFTGARRGDVATMAPPDNLGWIEFQPAKTAKKTSVTVWIPTFAIPQLTEAVQLAKPMDGRLLSYYSNRTKRRHVWTSSSIGDRWRDVLKPKAGLNDEDLHWHDLRGTLVTMLSEVGCTDDEQASITGHSLGRGSSLGNYKARTKKLALSAYHKLAEHLAPKRSADVVKLRGS